MVVPLLPLVAAGAAAGVLLRVATKHRDLLSWRPFAEASGTRDGRLVYGLDPWRTLRDAHQVLRPYKALESLGRSGAGALKRTWLGVQSSSCVHAQDEQWTMVKEGLLPVLQTRLPLRD